MIRHLPFFLLAFLCLITVPARAQFEHQLVRRLVVFPIKAEKEYETSAVEAWWQAREEFTKSRRFLVASKQFLVRSDVFQPRGGLEPADAVILGKLLDSHGLVTLQLEDRRLTMNVYDGGSGILLFRRFATLHPSLTTNDQLSTLARQLVDDFIASIPYQGFTINDSMTGRTVSEEGDIKLVRIDLGIGTGAQVGDLAQWIKLISTNAAPVFQGGAKVTVFAEGKVVQLSEGIATVEISRATSLDELHEYALVRLPREADRLRTEYSLREGPRTTLTAELVSPEAGPMQQVVRERRPLVTTLSFVGSLAVFVLLAF